MSLLQWLGKKIGLTDSAFWRAYFNTETWSGEPVSADVAMQVGAFWACTRLISQTVGVLPLNLYERKADGSREILVEDRRHKLMNHMPNAEQNSMEFMEGLAAALCVYGNSFAEKEFTGVEVSFLKPMVSELVVVERTDAGRLQYRYRDPLRRNEERILRPEQVLHVKGFGFGGDLGLSPVAFARQSLGSARAIERTAASTFANGLRPSGWLVYKDGTLDDKQREQVRKQLIEPMQGPGNAGKTGVLEADFDYRQMSIPPEEAQMLESRAFSVEDICRWFGVPPILVGHATAGQTMWGSGIEQILLGWLTLGVTPYLRRFEKSVQRALIKPEDMGRLYFGFDVDALLAADSAARATLFSNYAQNGVMTRNEIRAKLNLPKQDGGDVLTVQVNLTPLAKLARTINEPTVAAPPADGQVEEETPPGKPALKLVS